MVDVLQRSRSFISDEECRRVGICAEYRAEKLPRMILHALQKGRRVPRQHPIHCDEHTSKDCRKCWLYTNLQIRRTIQEVEDVSSSEEF